MNWGVIQHDGRIVHYIIQEGKVKAFEVGSSIEIRSPELLAAIEADIEHQLRKKNEN